MGLRKGIHSHCTPKELRRCPRYQNSVGPGPPYKELSCWRGTSRTSYYWPNQNAHLDCSCQILGSHKCSSLWDPGSKQPQLDTNPLLGTHREEDICTCSSWPRRWNLVEVSFWILDVSWRARAGSWYYKLSLRGRLTLAVQLRLRQPEASIYSEQVLLTFSFHPGWSTPFLSRDSVGPKLRDQFIQKLQHLHSYQLSQRPQ